jgi:hypothetical protein
VEKAAHAVFHKKLAFPLERFVLPRLWVEARAAACLKKFFLGHASITMQNARLSNKKVADSFFSSGASEASSTQ